MTKIIARTELEIEITVESPTTKLSHKVTEQVNHSPVDWNNPNQVLNWFNKTVLEKVKYNVVDYKCLDIIPNLHHFEYLEFGQGNHYKSLTVCVESNFWKKTTNPKNITLDFYITDGDTIEFTHKMNWRRTRPQWTFWDWMEEIKARDLIGLFVA